MKQQTSMVYDLEDMTKDNDLERYSREKDYIRARPHGLS